MNKTTCNNVNSKRFIDTVISEDNLMYIGEKITFTAFATVEQYECVNLRSYTRDMYRNIKQLNTESTLKETLSDGYEILQECMIYLCNFIGRRLGDICKTDKNGKLVSIYLAALRFTANFIRHYVGIFHEKPEELNENIPYHTLTVTEDDYDRAEAIIAEMHLSRKQSAVLECLINDMRIIDIAEELDMFSSNVCEMRKRIQK